MSLLPWRQSDFREKYAEAWSEFEAFQRELANTIRECNAGNDLVAIKEYFETAHAHYKEASRQANLLSIQLAKRTKDKKSLDLTPQQVADNALVQSLEGLISTDMNYLLGAYRPWLAKAQFLKNSTEDEEAP